MTSAPAVGLNALWVAPGVVGGSEESTVGTLTALAAAAPTDLQHVLFVTSAFERAHPDVTAVFECVVAPAPPGGRAGRVAVESTWLVAQTRRHSLAAVHHLGGTVPPLRGAPSLVTVHDLQPLDLPENFSRGKVAYLRVAVPRSVRAAAVVVTPSDFVRQTVIERFELDPDGVVTVHHGVDRPAAFVAADELRPRYGLPERWVVLPAITYPHKNHELLLQAFAQLTHDDVALVLTGGVGPHERAVRDTIVQLGLGDRVARTNRIPRADLQGLVHHAAALVFPSRYEGFGLPVVEAMAWDCPVLAAAATALPEVVGDGGQLLPPDDPGVWAAALDHLLSDPDEGDRWRAAGLARAATFTWERTGAGVLDAQRLALARAGV